MIDDIGSFSIQGGGMILEESYRLNNGVEIPKLALGTWLIDDDKVADAVRSILDGHIVLSRAIAAQNHFPAIDVLASVSRVMNEVVDDAHLKAAQNLRALMAVYKEAEDLIHIGAYVKGSSQKIDTAVAKIDAINDFLCQGIFEQSSYEETEKALEAI